jgi:endonuclease/exonuclease/phosphatase family metal-dependent hydrolase
VATGRAGCPDRRGPVLRVLQFNIRAARNDEGRVDLPEIAAEIRAVRPDLVSLNEVDTDTTRTHADEPAYLAGATGLHVVYGPNVIYDGGPFGNAVLSRYPVVDSHNLRLPGTTGMEPRGLLTVMVDVAGRRVVFASTHLSDGIDGRESRPLQALAASRALRSTSAPTILAGDLNSVPADLPARILRRHLLDAQQEGGSGPGDTYPQTSPGSRLDYILHDRRLAVLPGSTQVRASGSSDHRSLFSRLTLLGGRGCSSGP